jgi:hypothetical protein
MPLPQHLRANAAASALQGISWHGAVMVVDGARGGLALQGAGKIVR